MGESLEWYIITSANELWTNIHNDKKNSLLEEKHDVDGGSTKQLIKGVLNNVLNI